MIYFFHDNTKIDQYSIFVNRGSVTRLMIPNKVPAKTCRLNARVTSARKSEQNRLESLQRESGENREEACLVTSSETFILALLALLCSTAHVYASNRVRCCS